MTWNSETSEAANSSCVIVDIAEKCALLIAKTKNKDMYCKDNPLLALHKSILKTALRQPCYWGSMTQAVSPGWLLCCTPQPCTGSDELVFLKAVFPPVCWVCSLRRHAQCWQKHLKPDISFQALRSRMNLTLSVGFLKYIHKGKARLLQEEFTLAEFM